MNEFRERAKRFKHLQATLPEPGDVLECLDGEPATVVVDHPGRERCMFTSAVIDKEATGWYLKHAPYGIKILIDRENHERLMKAEYGIDDKDRPVVYRLRIVRHTMAGTGLIGELLDE